MLLGTRKYDKERQALLDAVADADPPTNLKTLSLALGRNHAYLQQYLERRSPLHLPEPLRYKLADLLGIDEAVLMPDAFRGALSKRAYRLAGRGGKRNTLSIDLPLFHDGAAARIPARNIERIAFVPRHGHDLEGFALVVAGDDAMAPHIVKDDVIVINGKDRNVGLAGFFAINARDHVRIRFIEQPDPERGEIIMRHRNETGFAVKQALDSVNIMGRAVWQFSLV